MVTQEEIKSLLKYKKKKGIFTFRKNYKKYKKGDKLHTSINGAGYPSCGILKNCILVHRLAWFYMNGYLPKEGIIHHKDSNKLNFKWKNLEHISQQCNIIASGNLSNNTSGIKGVTWHRTYNKWQANIKVNGKNICLGRRTDKIEAACLRLAGEQCLNWSSCNTNSTAYIFVTEELK